MTPSIPKATALRIIDPIFLGSVTSSKAIKFMLFSFFLGFLISGWFYIGLFLEYGSFTTFNQSPTKFKLSNQPIEFYLPFTNEAHMVFTKPIRPYFRNQFLPILYSDLWGDYWGYFSFTSGSLHFPQVAFTDIPHFEHSYVAILSP